jgi:hypothetical protein
MEIVKSMIENRDEQLYTVAQLAEKFGVSVRKIRLDIAENDIEPESFLQTEGSKKPTSLYKSEEFSLLYLTEDQARDIQIGSVVRRAAETPEGRAKLSFVFSTLRLSEGDITQEQFISANTIDPLLFKITQQYAKNILSLEKELDEEIDLKFKWMRGYDEILDKTPDRLLSEDQLSRKKAPRVRDLSWMFSK